MAGYRKKECLIDGNMNDYIQRAPELALFLSVPMEFPEKKKHH